MLSLKMKSTLCLLTQDLISTATKKSTKKTQKSTTKSCADPESFVRGGPTLTFLDDDGREGHHPPSSETPFKWRFAGVPMMAQH